VDGRRERSRATAHSLPPTEEVPALIGETQQERPALRRGGSDVSVTGLAI
jgi:hypothetical protein